MEPMQSTTDTLVILRREDQRRTYAFGRCTDAPSGPSVRKESVIGMTALDRETNQRAAVASCNARRRSPRSGRQNKWERFLAWGTALPACSKRCGRWERYRQEQA